MPEFLKTGLAKIRTHSTTWQLKTTRFVQRPIKKPISDAGQYSLRHRKCGVRGFIHELFVSKPERARYERVRAFDTNNE